MDIGSVAKALKAANFDIVEVNETIKILPDAGRTADDTRFRLQEVLKNRGIERFTISIHYEFFRTICPAHLELYDNDDKKLVKPITEEQIQKLAYELWEKAGKPDGDGVEYWLEAKKGLKID